MSKTKNVVIDDQNAAIEREQSQTGLNYAECEQGRPTGNKKQETIKYLAKPKNDVTSFFYYMWNKWSEEECRVVFNDPHFWNKWCEAYDTMHGPRGAAELFYMILSDTNRDKLVARALELYDGMAEKQTTDLTD